MKYSLIKKKIVPVIYNTFKRIIIKYFKFNLLISLNLINKQLIFQLCSINLQFNYLMVNKDIRLLWRESSLLLSFLLKMKIMPPLNNSLIDNILNKNLASIRQLKYLTLIQKSNKYLYVYFNDKTLNNKNLFIIYSYFLIILYTKKVLKIDFFQINKAKQLASNSKFSIIRSPFVYSKSKESYGSNNYNLIIRLKNFPNIFVSSY